MDPLNPDNTLNRRDLMLGAGMLSMMGMMQTAQAGGHTAPRELLTEDQQLALEKSNDELVANFMADYSKKDINLLASYLHDDIIYQITEGMPDVVGIEDYKKRNGPMLDGLEKVEWITLRQFAVGQLVINDRIDEFWPYPGSKTPRMRFRVSGYFLVVDNKIKIWRDFGYPGAKQLVKPAPKA